MIKPIVGRVYGRLTVISSEIRDGKRYDVCLCSCGKTKETTHSCLQDGKTTSCGCYRSERITGRRKKAPGEATTAMIKAHYTGGAKKRNYPWGLTDEQFKGLIFQNCSYCGGPPSSVRRQLPTKDVAWRELSKTVYNGIDRVDNTLGYTPENSVTCCKICNYAKNKMSKADFLAWVRRVAKHLNLLGD